MEPYQKEAFLEALQSYGQCEIRVHGGSMRPFLNNGQRILVAPAKPRPRIGQIIGVFEEDQLIVHRIALVRRTGRGHRIWIRGDAIPFSMTAIDYSEAICLVLGRWTGSRFERPRWNRAAVLIGPAIGSLLWLRRKLPAILRS